MKHVFLFAVIIGLAAAIGQPGDITGALPSGESSKAASVSAAEPSVAEQLGSLEEMCAKSAEARAARHADTPLYERLGGSEKIHELTREIVRLHLQNEDIKHLFVGRDTDLVAKRVAEFVITGIGGPEVYDGPALRTSHEHLGLTNADFLAAGGDVIQAMKNMGYQENEINEMVCILVSLRDQVVFTD